MPSKSNSPSSERHDDIVVGAGTAGAVVAARLSEDRSRRVLLLEAGADYTKSTLPPELGDGRQVVMTEHVWPTKATVDEARMVDYFRGRVIGGGSSINAAIAMRGDPVDYDEWSAWSDGVWSWEQVLPWFRQLENDPVGDEALHGTTGPLPIRRWARDELVPVQRDFLDAAQALGHAAVPDLNQPGSRGVGSWPMNLRGIERISTALAYLEPARARANLTVMGRTEATRILVEGGRVAGVEVRRDGETVRLLAERVTVCAGAVGTPELLLRSGIGPADELRALGIEPQADLPGVGANLLDHCMVPLGVIPTPGWADPPNVPTTQVGVRFTAPGSDESGDMQLYCTSYATSPPELQKAGVPWMFMVFPALVRPRSRGRVRLDPAAPGGPARVELALLADPEDERRLLEGLRHAWELLHTAPLASRVAAVAFPPAEAMAVEPGMRGYVRSAVQPIYHPVGTARMGAEGDEQAVVDARCRVRGVAGLRVADASVMPTIPRANTNLSCIMIGERVAAWLREG